MRTAVKEAKREASEQKIADGVVTGTTPTPQEIEDDQQKRARTAFRAGRDGAAEKFFLMLQGLEAAEWERNLLLYLYRLEPKRPNRHENPYITRWASPVDEELIKNTFGSGVYHLRLNRRDPKTGHHREVDTLVLNIEDHRFPPVMPGVDEWEKDPFNKRWAKWAAPDGVTKPAATAPSGDGLSGASEVFKIVDMVMQRAQPKTQEQRENVTTAVIDALRAANKEAVEMVVKQVDAQSPDKIVSLITALKDLVRPESAQGTLKDTLSMVREIIEITKQPQQTTTGLGQIKELAETVTVLKEAFGGDSGSGGGGKWGWLHEVAQAIPSIVGQTGYLLNSIAQLRGKAALGVLQPVLSAPAGGALAAIDPNSPEAIAQGVAGVSGAPAEGERQMMELIGLGQRLIGALQRGVPGDDFARGMIDLEGPLVYQRFAGMGKDGLLRMLQSYPPLWQQLEPVKPQLEVFLDDFLRLPEIERAEAEEETKGGKRGKK
jgi:hypothetical protein